MSKIILVILVAIFFFTLTGCATTGTGGDLSTEKRSLTDAKRQIIYNWQLNSRWQALGGR